MSWRHWSIGPVPLIWGDAFLSTLPKVRHLYISGMLGGGKTLLAYYLAMLALREGWVDRIISNIPSPISITAEDAADIRHSAIILDEAWQFLSTRAEAVSYGAALRKLGVLLLMPSVFPPNQLLSSFSAQRLLNLYPLGLPVWVYRYYLGYRSFRDSGVFCFLNPHLVAGWYDTEAYPAEDYGIAARLDAAVTALKIETARRLGRAAKEKKDEASPGPPAPLAPPPARGGGETADIVDVADRIADATDAIARAARRLRR